MPLHLSQKIEALLFYKTEPMSYKKISKILDAAEDEIREAILDLKQKLQGRGLVVMENNGDVALVTHPEMSELIAGIRKKELGATLSKSALETLTIITYQNGITKSDIDYIRGVNSNFILRNLLMRGLIERVPNPQDKRSPLYQPTMDTLAYLGIQSVDQLPEQETLRQQLEQIMSGAEDTGEEDDIVEDDEETSHEEPKTTMEESHGQDTTSAE
jgi:segregation and condensation protein B